MSPEEEREFESITESFLRASLDTKNLIEKRGSRVLEAAGVVPVGSEYNKSRGVNTSTKAIPVRLQQPVIPSQLSTSVSVETDDDHSLYRRTIVPLELQSVRDSTATQQQPARSSLHEIQDLFDCLESELGMKL